MGNVSHVVPAIHPNYKIGEGKAMNHTRPFAKVSGKLYPNLYVFNRLTIKKIRFGFFVYPISK